MRGHLKLQVGAHTVSRCIRGVRQAATSAPTGAITLQITVAYSRAWDLIGAAAAVVILVCSEGAAPGRRSALTRDVPGLAAPSVSSFSTSVHIQGPQVRGAEDKAAEITVPRSVRRRGFSDRTWSMCALDAGNLSGMISHPTYISKPCLF
mgnify:FL=1